MTLRELANHLQAGNHVFTPILSGKTPCWVCGGLANHTHDEVASCNVCRGHADAINQVCRPVELLHQMAVIECKRRAQTGFFVAPAGTNLPDAG